MTFSRTFLLVPDLSIRGGVPSVSHITPSSLPSSLPS